VILTRDLNFLFICISDSDSVTLFLSDNPGPVSEDITFTPSQNYTQGLPGKEQIGQTKVVEDSQYQNNLTSVTVIYSEVGLLKSKLQKDKNKNRKQPSQRYRRIQF
jgi:hypothetical protein